ncbi:Leucine-rich repeat and IQ domain-containing protein 3 (Leucine-rich repeat-containing protein 44) [Durusdinium trenchii]|uniref:Leucine-rich repeat and IQ domain-containing protein 3 (Leucine-rich repeat-containing protein 44) n=1 Tax=Durusdinium trenchii TaxID=1381693 RepID=A0ABP0I1W5_9DINO
MDADEVHDGTSPLEPQRLQQQKRQLRGLVAEEVEDEFVAEGKEHMEFRGNVRVRKARGLEKHADLCVVAGGTTSVAGSVAAAARGGASGAVARATWQDAEEGVNVSFASLEAILLRNSCRRIDQVVSAVKRAWRRSQGRSTVALSRSFRMRFPIVRVIDLADCDLYDEDLFQFTCGVLPNLTVLKLSGNRLNQLPGLHTCRDLQVLDVSRNKMTQLPTGEALWGLLQRLEVVMLHDNLLCDVSSLHALALCERLRHLTIRGNPLARRDHFRLEVVRRVPQLVALDSSVVCDSEHPWWASSSGIVEELGEPGGFCTTSSSWIVTEPENDILSIAGEARSPDGRQGPYVEAFQQALMSFERSMSTQMRSELRAIPKQDATVLTEMVAHSRALVVTRKRTSPALTLQRCGRGFVARRKISRVRARLFRNAVRIQALARGWHLRTKLFKDQVKLLSEVAPSLLIDFDMESSARVEKRMIEADETSAATRIQRLWVKRNMRFHKDSAATVIQTFFRSLAARVENEARHLEESGMMEGKVLLFPSNANLSRPVLRNMLLFALTRALQIEQVDLPGTAKDMVLAKSLVSSSVRFAVPGESGGIVFRSLRGLRHARYMDQKANEQAQAMRRVAACVEAARGSPSPELLAAAEAAEHESKYASKIREIHELDMCEPRIPSAFRSASVIKRRIAGVKFPRRHDLAASPVVCTLSESSRRNGGQESLHQEFQDDQLLFEVEPLSARVMAWTMTILRTLLRRPDVSRRYRFVFGDSSAVPFEIEAPFCCMLAFSEREVTFECSATLIQSVWRSHATRARLNLTDRIQASRAAICLQRMWRAAPFWARLSFVEHLAEYMRSIDHITRSDAVFYVTDKTSVNLGDSHVESVQAQDEISREAGSSFSGSVSQQPQSTHSQAEQTELSRSTSLYIEERILRAVRRLKGRPLLRDHRSLFAAQEHPISSDCAFDYSNALRLLSGNAISSTCYDSLLASQSSSRADQADVCSAEGTPLQYVVRPPPSHASVLRYANQDHEKPGGSFWKIVGLEDVGTNSQRTGTFLRVGIPQWLKVNLSVLDHSRFPKQSANTDLARMLTRGAVMTSGELMVPPPGTKGNGRYFEKITMAQRLGKGGHAARGHSNHVPSGVVLVRLKYSSRTEARARAALCFARTWQTRAKLALPLIAEHMIPSCLHRELENGGTEGAPPRTCSTPIPSPFDQVIKIALEDHSRLEEQSLHSTAIANVSEYKNRRAASPADDRHAETESGDCNQPDEQQPADLPALKVVIETPSSILVDVESQLQREHEERFKVSESFADHMAKFNALNKVGAMDEEPDRLVPDLPSTKEMRTRNKRFVRRLQDFVGSTGQPGEKADSRSLSAGKHASRASDFGSRMVQTEEWDAEEVRRVRTQLEQLARRESPRASSSLESTPVEGGGVQKIEIAALADPLIATDAQRAHRETKAKGIRVVQSEAIWLEATRMLKAIEGKELAQSNVRQQRESTKQGEQGKTYIAQVELASSLPANDGSTAFGPGLTPRPPFVSKDPRIEHRPARLQQNFLRRGEREMRDETRRQEVKKPTWRRRIADEAFKVAKERSEGLERERLERARADKEQRREGVIQAVQEQSFADEFKAQTLKLQKAEMKRAARSVMRRARSDKAKHVRDLRHEETVRQAGIAYVSESLRSTKQNDSKLYRFYTELQLQEGKMKRSNALRKMRMQIEHEKGIKSVVSAVRKALREPAPR